MAVAARSSVALTIILIKIYRKTRALVVTTALYFILGWIGCAAFSFAQSAGAPHGHAGAAARESASDAGRDYPKLVDITASTGIHFEHHSSPEQKYIVESMSGGVALIDYDRDGWPDIYFTNAQTVKMARDGTKARSADI